MHPSQEWCISGVNATLPKTPEKETLILETLQMIFNEKQSTQRISTTDVQRHRAL